MTWIRNSSVVINIVILPRKIEKLERFTVSCVIIMKKFPICILLVKISISFDTIFRRHLGGGGWGWSWLYEFLANITDSLDCKFFSRFLSTMRKVLWRGDGPIASIDLNHTTAIIEEFKPQLSCSSIVNLVKKNSHFDLQNIMENC